MRGVGVSVGPLFPLRKITTKICILLYSSPIMLAGTVAFPFIKEKEGEVSCVSTRHQVGAGQM